MPSFQAAGLSLDDLPPSSLVPEICQLSEDCAALQEELRTLKLANDGGQPAEMEEEESARPDSLLLGSPPPTSCGSASTCPHSLEWHSLGSDESLSGGSNARFTRMLMGTGSEEFQQSLLEMLQGRHVLDMQVGMTVITLRGG